jgi:hypothetical protein
MGNEPIAAWLTALSARYTRDFDRPQLLKAIRALSARYVQRRSELSERSAVDSAGKRAAFAAFFAPLHFFTTRAIVQGLGADRSAFAPRASADKPPLETIVDLGCGTGVAGAAWALELDRPAAVHGVDEHPWAVEESAWTWRQLRMSGRATRGDLVQFAERLVTRPGRVDLARTGIVLGWSVNELDRTRRDVLLSSVLKLIDRRCAVLVIEPIATRLTPWFDDWAPAFVAAGGRRDDWQFDIDLPPDLAALDRDAGFVREGLKAKSLWAGAPSGAITHS